MACDLQCQVEGTRTVRGNAKDSKGYTHPTGNSCSTVMSNMSHCKYRFRRLLLEIFISRRGGGSFFAELDSNAVFEVNLLPVMCNLCCTSNFGLL